MNTPNHGLLASCYSILYNLYLRYTCLIIIYLFISHNKRKLKVDLHSWIFHLDLFQSFQSVIIIKSNFNRSMPFLDSLIRKLDMSFLLKMVWLEHYYAAWRIDILPLFVSTWTPKPGGSLNFWRLCNGLLCQKPNEQYNLNFNAWYSSNKIAILLIINFRPF